VTRRKDDDPPDIVTREPSTVCPVTWIGRDCNHSDVGLSGRRVLSGDAVYPSSVAAISASEENASMVCYSAAHAGLNELSQSPMTIEEQCSVSGGRVREREAIRPETGSNVGEDFASGSSCFPLRLRGGPSNATSHLSMGSPSTTRRRAKALFRARSGELVLTATAQRGVAILALPRWRSVKDFDDHHLVCEIRDRLIDSRVS